MSDHLDETGTALPLAGVRVVDFSRLLPGPWASQMLGDLGADVIKVERPGVGDLSRFNAPLVNGESVYFLSVNSNKLFLDLELGTAEAAGRLEALWRWADVVIEGFQPATASRLGVDHPSVAAANPTVVHCSITGFGQTGPWSHVAGHDLAIQALAGLLDVTAGAVPSFQAADYGAAAMATIGILAALRRRDRTGEGAQIDVSMHDSALAMGNLSLASGLAGLSGASVTSGLDVWGTNPRYATYRTRDGRHVAACLLEHRFWASFCRAVGREDLIDPGETAGSRLSSHGERGDSYRAAIADYCASHDRDEIAERMLRDAIPVVPILSAEEALASDHVSARRMVRRVDHETAGPVVVPSNPLHAAGLTRASTRPARPMGADAAHVAGLLGST